MQWLKSVWQWIKDVPGKLKLWFTAKANLIQALTDGFYLQRAYAEAFRMLQEDKELKISDYTFFLKCALIQNNGDLLIGQDLQKMAGSTPELVYIEETQDGLKLSLKTPEEITALQEDGMEGFVDD